MVVGLHMYLFKATILTPLSGQERAFVDPLMVGCVR